MDADKILNIVQNLEVKSNNDLLKVKEILEEEHEKTKQLILNLTRHMDGLEDLYNKITKELDKRKSIVP